MKKLHLILLLVTVALSSLAQTVGEAFYIYRNDGHFNAFFRDEVDSIAYSNYDADSIYYDEAVMQVVYTQDSIYRIPLSAIDSVGFVQPETVFQENAHDLSSELKDYVTSVDSMTINLRSDTPLGLLPKIGDKLAHLGFSDFFPDGFVGEVVKVNSSGEQISIDCKGIPIEDAVKKFYGVYRLTAVADASRQMNLRRSDGKVVFDRVVHVGTIPVKINLNWFKDIWKEKEFLEGLKYGANGELQIEAKPIFDIKVAFCKDDLIGIIPYYSAHVVSDVSLKEDVKIMGEIKGEKKYPDKLPLGMDYPIGPGITFYIEGGIKFEGKGDVGVGASFEQSGRFSLDINFYPTPPFGYPFAFIPLNTINHKACMRGHKEEWLYLLGEFELIVGPYLEFGFGFVNHKISKIGAEFSCGVKCDGMVKLDPFAWEKAENSTDFYESCSESKLNFDVFLGSEGILACFDERLKFSKGGKIDLPWFHDEALLLPSFSNVKLSPKRGALHASSDVSGKCLIPLQLGFALFDGKGDLEQLKENKNKNYMYWTSASFSNYSVNFDNILLNAKYTVYPTINFLGKDILASPSAEMWIDFPVEITSFNQTASKYEKDGFTHNGKTYSYRYDCTVTTVLKDSEGVEDWGYVYRDPNGQETFISLKSLSSPYPDSRYAYYRNAAKDVVTLYPYVKYQDGERVTGEPVNYDVKHQGLTACPDDNHPHMIDLGLPSGTKWACCNVGANTPTDDGRCVAWGEMNQKDDYKICNYIYSFPITDGAGWVDESENSFILTDAGLREESEGVIYNFKDIGKDICGTQYDVAHVEWGINWRMPTLSEFQELIEYCKIEKTYFFQEDGTYSPKWLITGPNWGRLLFNEGIIWEKDSEDGSWVSYKFGYWSGTRDNEKSFEYFFAPFAYYMSFGDNAMIYSELGCCGKFIRPVYK